MIEHKDWTHRYVSSDYFKHMSRERRELDMVCPDVYRFPVVSDKFADDLLAIIEARGGWSKKQTRDSSSSIDPKQIGLVKEVADGPIGGVEMRQLGLDKHWYSFLRHIVEPIQEKIFIGYTSQVTLFSFSHCSIWA